MLNYVKKTRKGKFVEKRTRKATGLRDITMAAGLPKGEDEKSNETIFFKIEINFSTYYLYGPIGHIR